MSRIIIVVIVAMFLYVSAFESYAQAVAINVDGSDAHSSAALDVASVNKGVLVPRVNIVDLNSEGPVSSPQTSLLVYNTNGITGMGYYYWNGSEWVRLIIEDDERYLPDDPATSSVDMNDFEVQRVKALQGMDWDDNSGGADNKYRLLWRDGAHQFYNGGVVVGSYGNGTWGDLSDGRLIVEDRIGVGTVSPQSRLHVAGNARADGYIVAGNATTTSITRYGSQSFYYDNAYGFDDDGYRYINIGNLEIPAGAANVTVRNIVWECDAVHEDANEDHGLWVGIGSSTSTSYYGWSASVNSGYHYIDWHFVEDDLSQIVSAATNNVYVRLEDEDCWSCGGDRMILYNIHVEIYYSYTLPLQNGDLAASGRVYANNNTAVGDLAEHFEYSGPVVPGYVIAYSPGTDNVYVRCDQSYSQFMTGVISENPSVVLNSPNQGPPVALTGRVKVKLKDSDVLIRGGDFLTSSEVAGLAQKAVKTGPVLGYAVKNQKEGEDFVEILLQIGKIYICEENNKEEIFPDKSGNRFGKW